jgi:hypothetical protein
MITATVNRFIDFMVKMEAEINDLQRPKRETNEFKLFCAIHKLSFEDFNPSKLIKEKWNELDRVYSYINPILSKLHSDKKLWFYVPEIHRCIIDREHFNHLSIFK